MAAARRARANAKEPEAIPIHTEDSLDWGEESPIEPLEEMDEEEYHDLSQRRKINQGTRQDVSMNSQVSKTSQVRPKSKGQASNRSASQPPVEGKKTNSNRVLSKKELNLQVTGANADFPTLGFTHSQDPVMNMSWVLHSRLIVHKWKQFVWMSRFLQAFVDSRRVWRRNPRWLAQMFAVEVGAIWGHMGNAAKTLSGPRGPPMMR